MGSIVFIYFKDSKIKVLELESKNHEKLQSEGWKHTNTIDTCRYLEYLYNFCEDDVDILEQIKLLSDINS